jgi:hypothetical protein
MYILREREREREREIEREREKGLSFAKGRMLNAWVATGSLASQRTVSMRDSWGVTNLGQSAKKSSHLGLPRKRCPSPYTPSSYVAACIV